MAASSSLHGVGIVLLVLGLIGLVVGIGIAAIGPSAVTDSGSDGGWFGGGEENSEERNEMRITGAVVAGIGALLLLIGGVSYAAARR